MDGVAIICYVDDVVLPDLVVVLAKEKPIWSLDGLGYVVVVKFLGS